MVLVVKNPLPMQETLEARVQSLSQEDPLEEGMAIHSSILPGESHGQRSLVGYSPWGHKDSDRTEMTQRARISISISIYVCVCVCKIILKF